MPNRLEQSLKQAEKKVGKPLCARYQVLKERLFTQEYAHWATAFPGGNDHGPGHIERVLEKLDQLIDGNTARRAPLRPYELFLAMLSILYHDIGILRGRAGHADTSGLLVGDERNDYLIDVRDRDIISAAVVSHSSSKDIADETAGFADEELIGGQSVRPRVIAALVRLADELDEDFRRADPDLQRRLNVPEESRFFWEFCQRINGIKPDLISHNINIDVRFEADDVGRNVVVNGQEMPFIVAFGDKLAKMNRERRTVNSFLPEAVRYRYLKLSVKPLPGRQEWKHPREFVFGEHTLASEFVSTFSEFLAGDLDQATVTLNRLDEVAAPGTPADAAEPVLSPAPRFTPLQLVVTPEPRGDQLRLKVVNQGDGGQFSAKVISIVDNKGKSVVPQHWPIPWDNHAVTPTTITSLGKDYLDFAEYDRENIRTTKIVILQQVLRHGRAAPARRPVGEYDMQFSSLPDPIGVNFAIQGVTTTRLLFTVTIRISREDPPGQADWTFAIGVDEEEVVCDIIATPVLQGRRLPSVWLQPQQVNTSVPIASPTAISA